MRRLTPSTLARSVALTAAIGILLLLLPGVRGAEPTTPDPVAARQAMEEAVDRMARHGFVGHVLAVREGHPFVEASRGVVDSISRAPIDSLTVFAIGSVTKQFTRAAILKLAEEGRLSTDAPVSRHVPGWPADKQGITLEHLLTMRAGLQAYHDTKGDHERLDRAEALRRIAAQPLRFAPGTRNEYSNSGYTLLAVVVERVTGLPFQDYVRAALLDPAGLLATGFHGEGRWPDRYVARGTGARRRGAVNAPHHWPPTSWALMGNGGMVSSPRDLHRWVAALRAGKVLGPAALAKFYPRDPAAYAGGDDFGFATLVLEFDGGRDLVIVSSSAGARYLALGSELAEAMRGRPAPDEVKRMFPALRPGLAAPTGTRVVDTTSLPDTPTARVARAVLRVFQDGSPSALTQLVNERFTNRMRGMATLPKHLEILGEVSAAVRSASTLRIVPTGPDRFEIQIGHSGRSTLVQLRVQAEAPHRVEALRAIDQ